MNWDRKKVNYQLQLLRRKKIITRQQAQTIRGQIVAGDIDGAAKGMQTIVEAYCPKQAQKKRRKERAPVAQRGEPPSHKRWVTGSSPVRHTTASTADNNSNHGV